MNQLTDPADVLARPDALAESVLRDLPGASVLVFDSELRYILATGGALAEHGWVAEETLGRRACDVLPGERWDRLAEPYAAALRGESIDFEYQATDGERIYAGEAAPVRGPDGAIAGGVCVTREVRRARNRQEAPLLDPAMLDPLEDDCRDLVRRLLPLFASELDSAVADLTAAGTHGDAGRLAGVAHRLKGASRSVGAVAVASLCERLEVDAQAGDFARVTEVAGELESVGRSTLTALGRCAG